MKLLDKPETEVVLGLAVGVLVLLVQLQRLLLDITSNKVCASLIELLEEGDKWLVVLVNFGHIRLAATLAELQVDPLSQHQVDEPRVLWADQLGIDLHQAVWVQGAFLV